MHEKFYQKDDRKYELKNNREFIEWLLNSIDDGSRWESFIKFETFEDLIDSVVRWYELRYPDFMLEPFGQNPLGDKHRKLKDISKDLDVNQFLFRLPLSQQILLNVEYGIGGNTSGNYTEIEDGEYKHKGWVGLYLYDILKNEKKSVLFDSDGYVLTSDIKSFKGLNLDEVLLVLKKDYRGIIDYCELENVVKNYYFKIELRHRLLQLSALKILYTGSNPDIGYIRSIKFIEDFNDELGLLLSNDEVYDIYNEYRYGSVFKKVKIL